MACAPDANAKGAGATPDRSTGARVVEVARTEVRVWTEEGEERSVRVLPRVHEAGGLVVGDLVRLDGPEGGVGTDARVVEREARKTLLQRRAPGNARESKLLAANVDVGLVVLAPRADGLSLGFLDRALAALADGDIDPQIVVTKIDLQEGQGKQDLEKQLAPWSQNGVPVHFVSSVNGAGIEGLRDAIAGRVAVLLGHSGVGKSTLVNALDPDATQAVGAVRSADGKGRHTTTASRLIPFVDRGAELGALVDTPGIRQLVPVGGDVEGIAKSIPELAPYLGRCRFSDCTHSGEPDCVVTEAADHNPAVRAALGRLRRLMESLDVSS